MIPSYGPGRAVYIRRRFVVALGLTAMIALAWTTAARADAPYPAGPTIVVGPGDSIWGLGERYAPVGSDLRRWVVEVERINHLDGDGLMVGQELRLPA